MLSNRTLAAVAGALYLLTFVTSFPALALKESYLRGDGGPLAAQWGAVLKIFLALACIGTAVFLYPIARKSSSALAIGFVASRVLEASTIVMGVLALLSVMTRREAEQMNTEQMSSGITASEATSVSVSDSESILVALHDWAFLLGPGLIPAVNALLLGTILYAARLVPRIIPLVGLIGAPLLAVSALGTILGVVDQVSPLAGLLALPIAVWEFSLGVWLVIKGVNSDYAAIPRLPQHATVDTQ